MGEGEGKRNRAEQSPEQLQTRVVPIGLSQPAIEEGLAKILTPPPVTKRAKSKILILEEHIQATKNGGQKSIKPKTRARALLFEGIEKEAQTEGADGQLEEGYQTAEEDRKPGYFGPMDVR